MTKSEIEQIIPHRDPFLLVDEIVELEVGVSAKGIKYVNHDEYYFKGHFPKNPVMPGVLIVETMAQIGAVAALTKEEYQGKTGYLVGIEKAKFRQVVKPGDKLVITAKLTSFKRGIGFAESIAFVDEKVVCEAKLSFAIR